LFVLGPIFLLIFRYEKLKDVVGPDGDDTMKTNVEDYPIKQNNLARNLKEEMDFAERKVQEQQTQRLILKIKQLSTKQAELKMQLNKNEEQKNVLTDLLQNTLCAGKVFFSNEINIEYEDLDEDKKVNLKLDTLHERDFEMKFVSLSNQTINIQDEVFDAKPSLQIGMEIVKEIIRLEIPHFQSNRRSGFLITTQKTEKVGKPT
jgi:hypothetical protein